MAFMTWSKDLVTGVDIVDKQHFHLVEMVNEAARILLEGAQVREEDVDRLFAGLMDYSVTHFRTEEDLMVAHGVDPRVFEHHCQTHAGFVREVVEMAGQFRAGTLASDRLVGFLAGWLLFHILGEDQTMARQVHAIEAGAAPIQAYDKAEGDRLGPDQGAMARTMVTLYTQLSGQLHELELHGKHFERLVKERTAHLKEMTVDLAKARDAAEAASRAKSRFIGAISHELRTPMNAVLGFSHLLHGGQLPPKQDALAQKIVQSSENLLKLINDLIDYASLDNEQESLQTVSFRLQSCLDDACGKAFETARSKGIVCRIEIAPDVPAQFKGDERRIVSAFRQFVDNAAKFTERGSVQVRVGLLAADGVRMKLRLAVRDSGIGIPKEKQAELFLAFQQLDDSTSRKYAGIGLGLALAHHLVDQMGGEVGVQSLPGKGSQFWMDIWLTPDAEPLTLVGSPVEPAARESESVPQPGKALDGKQVTAVLDRVSELLRQADTAVGEYFDSEAACLRQTLGIHFDEIAGQIDRFEYDRALTTLDELASVSMRQMEKQT